jgi:hypothetical protein
VSDNVILVKNENKKVRTLEKEKVKISLIC